MNKTQSVLLFGIFLLIFFVVMACFSEDSVGENHALFLCLFTGFIVSFIKMCVTDDQ